MLPVGQGNTGHSRAAYLGKVQRQTAPAAANVENGLIDAENKLCSKMTFLGKLGIIQCLRIILEICATVLTIGIQEQRIKAIIEIVMMRHIPSREQAEIQLTQTPTNKSRRERNAGPNGQAAASVLTHQERKH